MNISVIVPCRNEIHHIVKFLDSVLAQELGPSCQMEVLVADGMSDDGSRDLLRAYAGRSPQVRLIDNPRRIVSTGLNAAIAASTGDIIVRMDVHTTYARNYIRECIRALNESGADNVGGPWRAEGNGVIGQAIAAAFESKLCTGGGKAHDRNYEGEVDTVYLGCWRREVFARAGLFDPALVRNQDDEFNFRLRLQGGRIWQSPRIQSSYTPRNSITALFRQYLQYGYWKVAVIRKHKAVAAWRHLAPALFISSLMAGVALMLIAMAGGAHTAVAAAGTLLAVEIPAYALVCMTASIRCGKPLNPWARLILPGVIAIYHFAYGLGFLAGLVNTILGRSEPRASREIFSALTR